MVVGSDVFGDALDWSPPFGATCRRIHNEAACLRYGLLSSTYYVVLFGDQERGLLGLSSTTCGVLSSRLCAVRAAVCLLPVSTERLYVDHDLGFRPTFLSVLLWLLSRPRIRRCAVGGHTFF